MKTKHLQKLLHKFFYHDTCEVWRAVKVEGMVDDFELRRLFECEGALHTYNKENFAHRDDVSQKLTTNLRWCCDPDVDIRPNDFLKINHQNQEWELAAGEKFSYMTHCEISVRRRKEAGQK